ncbi:myosin light chain kinase, smooth muscle-like [Heptranchias perlo]|uniref:myosin light chain kinase, smooth muscle-like n=1 Tax=Heptranchias perlo TaxID=212740 RepID=UPI00355A4E91
MAAKFYAIISGLPKPRTQMASQWTVNEAKKRPDYKVQSIDSQSITTSGKAVEESIASKPFEVSEMHVESPVTLKHTKNYAKEISLQQKHTYDVQMFESISTSSSSKTVSSERWEESQKVAKTETIRSGSQSSPKILQDMNNVAVLLGETTSLKCQILAFPRPEITWYRENQEVVEVKRIKIVTITEAEVLTSSEIIIQNVQEEDTGIYRCKAVNPHGEAKCEAEITVTAAKPILEVPMILLELSDLRVKAGQMAQFICSFRGESFPEVIWSHRGRRLEESEKLKISQNGNVMSLTILNVHIEDQGQYSCTARNESGEMKTTAVLIVEAEEAKPKTGAKIFTDSSSDSSKTEKRPHITSDSKSEVRKKPSSPPPSSTKRPTGTEKPRSRDYYPDVVPCDELIDTGAIAPAFLEKLPSETIVHDGEDVLLFCIVKGVPSPCVLWLCNQRIVEESSLCSIKHDGMLCSLKLQKVSQSYSGTYTCKAVNSAGETACNTLLRVTGWQLHALVLPNVTLSCISAQLMERFFVESHLFAMWITALLFS